MKTLPLTLGLLALVLSACSLIQAALPDQPVDNLLGIDGAEVSTTLVEQAPQTPALFSPPAALSRQANSVWMPFFTYRSVADPDTALPFNPEALEQQIVFSRLTLSGTAASFPEQIEVNASGLFIALWDGFSAPEVQGWDTLDETRLEGIVASYLAAADKGLVVTHSVGATKLAFVKEAGSCGGSSCSYTLNADSDDLTLALDADMAHKAHRILNPTEEDETLNSVAAFAAFELISDPMLEAGLSATLKLSTPAGTIKFH